MHVPPGRIAAALAIAAAACAAAVAPLPASALRISSHATAACQSALPVFDTQIRKRPLAVQNEGDSNAFVTCSMVNPAASSGINRISSATIHLQNVRSGTRSVSCTAVNSMAAPDPGTPLYLTKTVSVPRDAEGSTALQFNSAEFPGSPLLLPGDSLSVSCQLQPGIGVTSTVLFNNAT